MKHICFTGYRPAKLPFVCSSSDEAYRRFEAKAAEVLAECAEGGDVRFYSGMAQGSDMILAALALKLKTLREGVQLECVLPFAAQTEKWSSHSRSSHDLLLQGCDKVTVLAQNYCAAAYMRRNRYMVDCCDTVIAVYDGMAGGTKNTVDYAIKKGRRIVIINPHSLHTIKLDMLI